MSPFDAHSAGNGGWVGTDDISGNKNAFRASCCRRFQGEATGNHKGLNCNSDNKLRGKVVDLGIRGIGLARGGVGRGHVCTDLYLYTASSHSIMQVRSSLVKRKGLSLEVNF